MLCRFGRKEKTRQIVTNGGFALVRPMRFERTTYRVGVCYGMNPKPLWHNAFTALIRFLNTFLTTWTLFIYHFFDQTGCILLGGFLSEVGQVVIDLADHFFV